MFQNPVNDPDYVRGMRPWVKGMLQKVGLHSCQEWLKNLKGSGPGDRYFYNTSWPDVSPWELCRKKIKYRTKLYCCSLCKYSANTFTSFKNHFHRCHQDETAGELQVQCPECPFFSRPAVVGRHFQLFHQPSEDHSSKMKVAGKGRASGTGMKRFVCLKCNFSNPSICSMKKHVLITHFHSVLNTYIGLRAVEGRGLEEGGDVLSVENTLPPERYYCKKCSTCESSQGDLMSHVLMSGIHKDLETKLRLVISEHKRTGLPKQTHIAPKPKASLSSRPDTGVPAETPSFHLALNSTNLAMVQVVTGAPGTSWSLTGPLPTAVQPQMALVSSPLPVGQTSLTLQPSAPLTVFYSGRAPLTQPVNPPVLTPSQPLGPVNKSVGMSIVPVNQAIQPEVFPLTQPKAPTSRSVGPPLKPIGPRSGLMGPGIPPSGLSVSPGVLQTTSPGMISVGQMVPLAALPADQVTPASVIPTQTAVSGVFLTGQVVQSEVFHVGQTAPSQVLPSGQTLPFRVFPVGQVAPSGLLSPKELAVSADPVNQVVNSGVLPVGQPMTSEALSAGPPVRPKVLQLSQSVGTRVLPVSQPVRAEPSPNTMFLKSGSVLRKLYPTGIQMNGKPIYTLDPMSVTLPVPQGASLVAVTPSQTPIQFLPSEADRQTSSAQPNLPSLQGLESTADQSILVQATLPEVDLNLVLRQAMQWKICPACNVFFPSSAYQAHMEVAHKQQESSSSEKYEPEKVAVCAPFLKWMRGKSLHCLACKCLVSEEELMYHLLTHGLGCLFCPCTFHNIRRLLEHSRNKHLGKKRLSLDYSNRGFGLNLDADGSLLFSQLDFITTLPREKLGEREACLAILTGIHFKSLVPLYVKVRPEGKVVPRLPSKHKQTCPFCFSTFMIADAYKLHLRERHHVMLMAHTMLRPPVFKCVYCFGVYTGNLTTAAITGHLLHCKCAPKDSSLDLQVQSDFVGNSELKLVSGKTVLDSAFPVKRKWSNGHLGAEDHRSGKESMLDLKVDAARGPEGGTGSVLLKKRRNESMTKGLVGNDLLQVLALDPRKHKYYSYKKKKKFLKDYFHKKPYPSRREIELLSMLLSVGKINVASFFGKRRYICMKTIKIYKPSVILGFDMSELKNVKHRLNFESEPQNSA